MVILGEFYHLNTYGDRMFKELNKYRILKIIVDVREHEEIERVH